MKLITVCRTLSLVISLIFIIVLAGCASATSETTATTTTAAVTTEAITTTKAAAETTVLDPQLTGKWIEENNSIVQGLPYKSVEYLADGTCIVADPDTKGESFLQGTYQIVDGKQQFTFGEQIFAGEYKIEGTKLTIYNDDGESKVYNKE